MAYNNLDCVKYNQVSLCVNKTQEQKHKQKN